MQGKGKKVAKKGGSDSEEDMDVSDEESDGEWAQLAKPKVCCPINGSTAADLTQSPGGSARHAWPCLALDKDFSDVVWA